MKRDLAQKHVRTIALTIEYDGTGYAGWQVQNVKRPTKGVKLSTIQETIEGVLRRVLRHPVRLIASGRTDAGVHAQGQVAHFRTASAIPLKKLQHALNGLLPGDIAVSALREKPPAFHSRFSAKGKVYRYTILHRRSPSVFFRDFAYHYPYHLDIARMRKEARALVGRHDFTSFKAAGKEKKDATRTITSLTITRRRGFWAVEVRGNGFLHTMVRTIVGTLLEIGRGRFPPGSMRTILRARDRKQAGPTAPARGLCLVKVKY